MKLPELLAPVGSWEALEAAVANGADAVYLGGKNFSARQYAANFDRQELGEALDFAHLRGVKVFVAVNTLVADQELPEALDYLGFLYERGADAVILQDLGLAALARKYLPDLELHASTQMTIHNAAGVRQLEELGFQRVVLAREVSWENMKRIRARTRAELEVFVHGALCICYSGQCLMSSLIGGRSGNRGRCAQPCRLQYTLVDQQGRELTAEEVGKHLLSPRDLNLVEDLPRLVEAGINSLKIEGRMKRPEYVATVVRVYRQALDRLAAGAFQVTAEEKKDLAQIFNRDFTRGYFAGNPGAELMSYKRPNNRGLKIGRVSRVDRAKRRFELALEEPLRVGDGLEIWVKIGGRLGLTSPVAAAAGEKVWLPSPGQVSVGDRVFKTLDIDLMERARREVKPLPVTVKVEGSVGQPLHLVYLDEQGNRGEAWTAEPAQQARKRPLTEEVLWQQLGRLGNTPYQLIGLEARLQGEIMVPLSLLNEARRQAISRLTAARLKPWARPAAPAANWQPLPRQESRNQGRPLLTVQVASWSGAEAALAAGADLVYLGAEWWRHQREKTDWAQLPGTERLWLATPRILQEEEWQGYIPWLEQILQQRPPAGLLVSNLGLLHWLRARGYQGELVADWPLNAFNQVTVQTLQQLGASRITLSPELTGEQVLELAATGLPLEVLVHGHITMMVSEYCAVGSLLGGRRPGKKCSQPCRQGTYGLKDRLNLVFPLRMDQFCHMHVFNPRELALLDELPLPGLSGLKALRLDLRLADPEKIRQVVAVYWQALAGKTRPQDRELLQQLSPGGLTKGHWYRGVLQVDEEEKE
ncbi:MAG: DUF3656 domain-containing U32 family peptidase [Bacillota bacterium]